MNVFLVSHGVVEWELLAFASGYDMTSLSQLSMTASFLR